MCSLYVFVICDYDITVAYTDLSYIRLNYLFGFVLTDAMTPKRKCTLPDILNKEYPFLAER